MRSIAAKKDREDGKTMWYSARTLTNTLTAVNPTKPYSLVGIVRQLDEYIAAYVCVCALCVLHKYRQTYALLLFRFFIPIHSSFGDRVSVYLCVCMYVWIDMQRARSTLNASNELSNLIFFSSQFQSQHTHTVFENSCSAFRIGYNSTINIWIFTTIFNDNFCKIFVLIPSERRVRTLLIVEITFISFPANFQLRVYNFFFLHRSFFSLVLSFPSAKSN